MMFFGTADGKLKATSFPFETSLTSEVNINTDLLKGKQIHSSAVNKLRVSYDNHYLFSTSGDGCLYISTINKPNSENIVNDNSNNKLEQYINSEYQKMGPIRFNKFIICFVR